MPKLLKTFLLACIVLSAPAALACPGGDKQGHKQCDHKEGQCPYHNKKSWSEKLSLEGDQAKQVDALEQEFKEKRKALKEAHHAAMSDLKTEQTAALGDVLTAEQVAQLDHSHTKKHHGHHSHDGHGEYKKHKQCPHKKAHGE